MDGMRNHSESYRRPARHEPVTMLSRLTSNAMVAGTRMLGKSTFINSHLRKRNVAKTRKDLGCDQGKTMDPPEQKILELLDTPGILLAEI